jgi:hypothetical protein
MLAPPVGAFVYSVAPAALWTLCAVAAIGAGVLAWRSARVATPRHEPALAAASDPAPKAAA